MSKVGTYKIIESSTLIVEYYSGTITVEDLISSKEVISQEPSYNFYFNTIIDVRDCELILTMDDLKKLNNYFDKKFNKKGIRKVAYLVDTPHQAALSTLFSRINKSKIEMHKRVFSTVEGIVLWFKYESIDESALTLILKELKTLPNNVFGE